MEKKNRCVFKVNRLQFLGVEGAETEMVYSGDAQTKNALHFTVFDHFLFCDYLVRALDKSQRTSHF